MSIPKCSNKEVRTIVRKAYRQGWTFKNAGSGHLKAYSPDKKHRVTISTNPNRVNMILCDMKRGGYRP